MKTEIDAQRDDYHVICSFFFNNAYLQMLTTEALSISGLSKNDMISIPMKRIGLLNVGQSEPVPDSDISTTSRS